MLSKNDLNKISQNMYKKPTGAYLTGEHYWDFILNNRRYRVTFTDSRVGKGLDTMGIYDKDTHEIVGTFQYNGNKKSGHCGEIYQIN